MIENSRKLHTTLEFTPKTYEIDFSGIVNNCVYVKWLEDLRLAMLARFLPLNELLDSKMAPVILSTNINYHVPVRLFEVIIGHIWLVKLGHASWEIEAKMVRKTDGCQVTSANQRGVLLNMLSKRPERIPHQLRKVFEGDFCTK